MEIRNGTLKIKCFKHRHDTETMIAIACDEKTLHHGKYNRANAWRETSRPNRRWMDNEQFGRGDDEKAGDRES